ncbi:MAG TPA: phage/plasmid primase, P4 family, partial [Candidatus Paceibacterota bacterium]|nr:phage/plasmid primase, P4 family [Candidatus Paceibacterota bacterium]
ETDTAISQDDFFKNLYVELLPDENGILNVRTRELSPFDPTKIFFNKLPVEYDDEAICPSIDKFLRDILSNEEDVSVAYEIIGSGLLKDYFTEKAAMLVGGGRNGKSKFLELIRRIAGIRNTSSVPIRAMKEDNSSLCELHGKLFNLAGDLSGGDLKFTGVFKETVGRDTLQAHRKFLRDLIFVNYAKHIFACNELPRVFDTTDGFWDKWILLEFPYKFITKEERATLSDEDKVGKKIKDPEIIEKITSPEELSGLLNEALDGLDRLFKMKGFSQTIGTKEIKDFWIRKSDSFTAFCIDNLEDDVDGYVTKKGIRKRFSQYCRNHNIKGAGDKDIKITLENRFGATEGSKVIDYTQERVWEGIKFKNLHMK